MSKKDSAEIHGIHGRAHPWQIARLRESQTVLGSRSEERMNPTTASALEPKTRAFVEALEAQGGPPLYELSYAAARAVLTNAQSGSIALAPARIEEATLPTGPTGRVAIRFVRPEGRTDALPVVMYCHGGGWVLGDKSTHDRLVRELAKGAEAAIVFVSYTPSPEAHFPQPTEEAYAATKYIAEHGAKFGLDSSRMAIAGDSVGGNMAAVVALLAKERGGPRLRYQVLCYPVTDARFDTASYKEFAEGPWLTKRAMQWFFDAYAPNAADRERPAVSPLRASLEDLRGLPPALVITDENDVLRDEGEAYAHKLMSAGVPVKALRVLGTIHDFMMLNGLAETPPVREAIAAVTAELRSALTP
jgi:acetyl esterase